MIKVLIVDDSPSLRAILTAVLEAADDIKVVGAAEDPYQARDMIKQLNPDVLTLDIEMPKMNGLSFLKNLMRLRPMPVIMLSTLTQQGSPATLEALELGAIDFIAKPTSNVAEKLNAYAEKLHQKIRIARQANLYAFRAEKDASQMPVSQHAQFKSSAVLALGASTGGTEALREVLVRLPKHCPPIVIAQHIPPVFSTSFALRMDRCCDVHVKEAEDGDVLMPGHVFIAPGDMHLKIVQKSGRLQCQLCQSEKVNRHRPSVDVLFDSLLPWAKQVSAGLLTGMGSDGAAALLRLREAGAKTLAQDEATSVVWGMPRAAVEIQAAEKVVPLSKVTMELLNAVKHQ
ncbi:MULTISPECIES: chemotaxis response regulator protein-glutamate methylesterase [unclassified Pseudoalteromonas]|uniref:protein-glutamate methylesterase/protein-glutamine glutaminase n=1 Tax=unclassified Pseudoalteromonas TaxID=194690 RepID=UPI00209685A4|nr:chemotaxis response regulator protein-glutamate methylesterase [Pseudoalteromonas sp. XMcav2-N]MCO7191131.1 chemotaxis response regulator protein-glutamate methylesterase [Pseudoalteromonas sp. XMcav2-N]